MFPGRRQRSERRDGGDLRFLRCLLFGFQSLPGRIRLVPPWRFLASHVSFLTSPSGRRWGVSVLAVAALAVTQCRRDDEPGTIVGPTVRYGDEIVAAGERFATGTPVVLWTDPDGYNAYETSRWFDESRKLEVSPERLDDAVRYGARVAAGEAPVRGPPLDDWTLDGLREIVDQFVIHYDAAATSRQCFKVLHDIRGLSVHFLLDVDGTIYQTLDLQERAWHAGPANDRSIGVEIANIGAYGNRRTLDQWYARDAEGWPYLTLPDWMPESGILTPDFVARPARREVIVGEINGRRLMQYDFTNEQYEALIRLTAALARVFPRIELDAPRDREGRVRLDTLSDAELASFSGLIGHWHLTADKYDPGPAFDWERVIGGARQAMKPPSMTSREPVTRRVSSLAR